MAWSSGSTCRFRADARSAFSGEMFSVNHRRGFEFDLKIDLERTEVNRRYRLYSAAVLLLASNPPQYFGLTEVSYNWEINLSPAGPALEQFQRSPAISVLSYSGCVSLIYSL